MPEESLEDLISAQIKRMMMRLANSETPTPQELLQMIVEGMTIQAAAIHKLEHIAEHLDRIGVEIKEITDFIKAAEKTKLEVSGAQKFARFLWPAVSAIGAACFLYVSAQLSELANWRTSIDNWRRGHCMHHLVEEKSSGSKLAAECREFSGSRE